MQPRDATQCYHMYKLGRPEIPSGCWMFCLNHPVILMCEPEAYCLLKQNEGL